MVFYIDILDTTVKCVKKRIATKFILHYGSNVYVTVPFRYKKDDLVSFLLKHSEYLKPIKNSLPKPTNEQLLQLNTILALAVKNFSEKMNLPLYPYKIKEVKSYWGKCFYSKKYYIFNQTLAILPTEIIEYVVIHELAHIKYHNHNKAFYDYISVFCKDYKKCIKYLKNTKIC